MTSQISENPRPHTRVSPSPAVLNEMTRFDKEPDNNDPQWDPLYDPGFDGELDLDLVELTEPQIQLHQPSALNTMRPASVTN